MNITRGDFRTKSVILFKILLPFTQEVTVVSLVYDIKVITELSEIWMIKEND